MPWNDISRDRAYSNDCLFPLLPKSGKWYSLNRTFTFRNHVTNRDYKKQQSGKKKDGE
ncbi:hypothetical protein [Limosilactobacillus reuteri]|uniref:hypothetical protein n=1 Tax=Limosilactobacillus reuteri TaxID=1598 RepID=UPI00163CD97E|nr:hypothetical protein [Limosilactobacillus reuteri]